MPDNAITLENARTDGRAPQSYWDVDHSSQIEGFATDISVNAGDQIDFKININGNAGSDYQVEIFRLGYYGGDGARQVAEWVNTDGVVQPDAEYDATRALVDAGNWSVTDSWDIPADAVSGVYLARVQRLDANGDPIEGATNQIPFIVREDDRPADIVLQTSDTTWHAYNGWFGNNGQIGANFYGDASGTVDHPDVPDPAGTAQDRAYAVSYNRPLITRGIEGQQGGPAAGAQDYLFGADYAAIHWLEQNGYDVAYVSGMDTERLGADYLKKYQSFISVGHDEYWSGDQRLNVEEARDAGVNLLFWGGNDIYWKTRWDVSIVDGQEYRTLVCYKETWAHGDADATGADYYNLDPSDIWTGTWRDIRFQDNPLAGGALIDDPLTGQPHTCNCAENSLTGQLFGPDGTGEFGGALDVPESYSVLRVWRDTTIADGGQLDIAEGILGYEWNTSPNDVNRPAGLIKLSETTIPWSGILIDQGNTIAPGVATHNLTIYRAESGAIVFGAGTVFWTWALSDRHDSEPYGAQIENTDLKQFTINLFADMGIQPGVTDAVLASQGLVRALASDDDVAATVQIDALPTEIDAYQTIRISGTATDDDGNPLTEDGVVAGVEVSLDGGATWIAAQGTTSWQLDWRPAVQGSYDIRVRAIDDSLNTPAAVTLPPQIITVNAPVPPGQVSLLAPLIAFDGILVNDNTPLTIGQQFVTTEGGTVTELRYYRAAGDANDTDLRQGHLWGPDGQLIGTVSFVSDPGQVGWQTATLETPVQIQAGVTYTVSYDTLNNYVTTAGFFDSAYAEPYGIMSAGAGSGVYDYGSDLVRPTSSFNGSNYWVDVTFARGSVGNDAPVFASANTFTAPENGVLAGLVTATDAEGAPIRYAIAGGADADKFWIDTQTGQLAFLFAPDFESPFDAGANNIYDLVVSASDGINTPTGQAISVTVTNVATETQPGPSNLFGPADGPAGVATDDPSTYELGVRFTASADGVVDSLRYYRGAADAGDTDIRTLNIWTDQGVRLGSVQVRSDAGDSGWQVGTLASGVALEAGQTYVVSYGTQQNYAYSGGFFASPWSGPDGTLSAGTGVFAAGGTGLFPTQSYNNTNYWVDLSFTPDATMSNEAPVFSSAPQVSVAEDQTRAAQLTATDANGDNLTYAITGGADADFFALDPQTGLLTFVDAPDHETPLDAGGDNIYDVTVAVGDGQGALVQQALTVTLIDIGNEPDPDASRLFAGTDRPAATSVADPTDYELGVRFTASENGSITHLTYYRGAGDAGDTDTRTLNLWSESGVNLGSVTVTSLPGQTGWQTAALPDPIAVQAGQTYVASYGTEQNYAYSSGYFNSGHVGPDQVLSASAGNGVFSAGGTGGFPTQSYNNTNYWVDVTFTPDTQLEPILAEAVQAPENVFYQPPDDFFIFT